MSNSMDKWVFVEDCNKNVCIIPTRAISHAIQREWRTKKVPTEVVYEYEDGNRETFIVLGVYQGNVKRAIAHIGEPFQFAKGDLSEWYGEYEEQIYEIDQRMIYKKYITTTLWEQIKNKKLEESGYQCALCGTGMNILHVHHITYKNVGCEKMSDLRVLCADCHKKVHEKDLKKKQAAKDPEPTQKTEVEAIQPRIITLGLKKKERKTKHLQLLFPESLYNKIDEMSKHYKLSKNEIMIQFAEKGIELDEREREEAECLMKG